MPAFPNGFAAISTHFEALRLRVQHDVISGRIIMARPLIAAAGRGHALRLSGSAAAGHGGHVLSWI